ncbi:MAG TPA: hypothetical protein PKB14_03700 [Rubrivivax sp.]|nr:hypothetical protein [Rubrivivax sp.]
MAPWPALTLLATLAAGAAAVPFKPWQTLRSASLRHPWLAALVLLPWLWSTAAHLPGRLPVQLSMASLTVLMFGWPLACWSWMFVGVVAAWLAQPALAGQPLAWALLAGELAWWNGVLPGTLALGFGLATRRWLPAHPMVYILARGFAATLLAMAATGALWVAAHPLPGGADAGSLLLGRWLIAWGDAVLTGMLTAIFVVYRPAWLLTWSDRRYLPPR